MEQMNIYDVTKQTWKDKLQVTIDRIATDEELPPKSLQLISNYGKDKEKVTSYSVAILKPDYPKGTNPNGIAKNVLINVKESKKMLLVSLPDSIVSHVSSRFSDIPLVNKKSDPITRASIAIDNSDFDDFFYYLIKLTLDKYFHEGSDNFGCCHLYKECSDARKCLHENKLYARGCTYGSHLAEGRIFYGDNRNV